jgi:cold shock CspA family protein
MAQWQSTHDVGRSENTMKGKIKKILSAKQCGFIQGDDGQDYFFHVSGLDVPPGEPDRREAQNIKFQSLSEGQAVKNFVETKGGKGPRAEHVEV